MGAYSQAEESFRAALQLNPRAARVYFNLGNALEGQEDWERAITAYKSAVRFDATYAKPLYNLGLVQERFGRRQSAITSYRGFLKLWRGSTQVAASARRRLALLEGDAG
jgi:tetratricopeptide (TPR) repeat protein